LIVEDQEDIVQAYRDILSPKTNVAKIKSSRSVKSTSSEENEEHDAFELVTVNSGEKALEAVKTALRRDFHLPWDFLTSCWAMALMALKPSSGFTKWIQKCMPSW